MSNENMKLWNLVEKTDPKYTKRVSFGRKYTAIDAQYQVREATKQFGSYGKWGLKNLSYEKINIDKDILLVLSATFFYDGGEFDLTNSSYLLTKGRVDTDAYKKIETDTLTKALSKLGFNADIFLGKYEDMNYINEVANDFISINQNQRSELAKLIQDGKVDMIKFNENFSISNLQELPVSQFEKAKAMLISKINKLKKEA